MSFSDRFKDATIGFSGYPRLIRDRASGFGFMALILALAMLVSGAIWTVRAKAQFAQGAQALANGPDFSLQNGQFTFTGQMPYKIAMDNGGFVIVDTTGQTTPDVLDGAPRGSILITKSTYTSTAAWGQFQTVNLPQVPVAVGKADIISLMSHAHWVMLLGHLLVYPFQLGFKSFDAVILGLVATGMASSMKQKLPFDTAWKIGLYAVTLPTIIQWVFPGFSTATRLGFGVWWLLAILYTVMGTRAYLAPAPVE